MVKLILSLAILFVCLVSIFPLHAQQTSCRYDTVGRLVEVIYPDSTSIRYAYDRNGNILSIIGTAKNAAPTAASATIVTDEDTPSAPVTPTVTDPDLGDTHTFAIVAQPLHGTALVQSNKLVYTPAKDYHGNDSLTFRATDAGGLSVVGIATITVHPVNDAPATFTRSLPSDASVQNRGAIAFSWTQATDVDGDAITYRLRFRVASVDSSVITQSSSATIDFALLGISSQRQTVTWSVSATDGIATTQASNNDGSFFIDSVSAKAPILALSQRSIAFGNVTVGKSKALPLTISNSGSDTLSVMAIMSSNTVFTFGLNSFTLIPSASMVDSLRFAPTSIGAVSAVMTIASNASTSPDTIFVTGTGDPATSVRDMTALGFTLKQNYPNPVFTSTTFEFTIPRASRVNLEVFNILGVKVAALIDQQLDPGTHQVLWKNISLADGMYVYRLRTGGIVLSRPLIINRERK